MDCGATCLRMISKHYGKNYNPDTLRELSGISKEGVSILGLSKAAEKIGFRTIAVKITLPEIQKEQVTPFIAHWQQKHFVVVYKASKDKVYVADPASDKITYTKDEFNIHWASSVGNAQQEGIALILTPSPDFYAHEDEKKNKNKISYLFKYLAPYKRLIVAL